MLVTFAGISMLSKFEQLSKADAPIYVTVEGILNLVIS